MAVIELDIRSQNRMYKVKKWRNNKKILILVELTELTVDKEYGLLI